VQLEVPENLRPTIYFEDQFTGEKLAEYHTYIEHIKQLVVGTDGANPDFRNFRQVLDFVNDTQMQTNTDKVNINVHGLRLKNVYPILVVDSDGMNPETIFQVIEESIYERKKPSLDRAGVYDFLEQWRRNVVGKFAVIIQCQNLETCKFERFANGISLQTNDVKNAVLGIKKNNRNMYAKGNWKVSLDIQTPEYLSFLVENQIQTLTEPDLFNTILEPFFEIHTSSIYLKKPKGKLSEKVVQRQDPDPSKLDLTFKCFTLPKPPAEEE
jgi:hypothetical protein